jgi:amino acid adenylation domain-containing protein
MSEDPCAVLAGEWAAQVRAEPDAIALRYEGKDITRGELDAWSDALAAAVQAAGVPAGAVVGLAAERGPATVAAVLSAVKAGIGFLPLDPQTPTRRQRALVALVRPAALMLQNHLDRLPTLDLPRIWLDDAGRARPSVPTPGDTSRVFHVVATSGTTAEPKAVRIGYGAVLNRLRWMWRDYPFPAGAALLAHKSAALVASTWELLGGLLRGVPTVIVRREEVLDPHTLVDLILAERITHLYLVPHLIAGLLDELDRRSGPKPPLVLVTSGADTLPVSLVRRFQRALPHTRLLNLYGTSETASNIAAYDTAGLPDDATVVPVGRPVAGAALSVRDRHGRPMPVGAPGEIHVGGPPLALGYLGDEDLTARRFVRQPDGSIRYRTGDVGYWEATGQLILTGRVDNQVKVRGYRVDLEGVETVLATAPQVDSAAVVAVGDGPDPLIACVTGPPDLEVAALRAYARDRLPDYMVPGRFVLVAALPLAASGKVDRRRLAEQASAASPIRPATTIGVHGPAEAALLTLWTSLLGAPPAAREQDFFDAGGHSLLAVTLASQLEQALGVRVPLRELLDQPTFTGIAAALGRATAGRVG